MASRADADFSGQLFGQYECTSCRKKWKSIDAKPDMTCKQCGEDADTLVLRSLKYSDIPEDRRLFGKFRCPNCNKTWMSANSWKGYKQQCKSCKAYAAPYFLNFLEFQGDSGDMEKPHLQELCEKCQELGHSCRRSDDTVDSLSDTLGRLVLASMLNYK